MNGLDIWLLKTNKEAILSEISIDERNLFLLDMFVLFYEILLKIFSWIMNTKTKTSIEPKNWIYIWTMNNKLKCDSLKNYLGLEPTYFMSHKLEDVRWNYFKALWNLGVWIKIFAGQCWKQGVETVGNYVNEYLFHSRLTQCVHVLTQGSHKLITNTCIEHWLGPGQGWFCLARAIH